MLAGLIETIGWILARLPRPLVRAGCCLLADLYYYAGSRRRTVLSQLHHAFPDRSGADLAAIARQSVRHTFEMFLLVVALPRLREEELRLLVKIGPECLPTLEEAASGAAVVLVSHGPLMESLALLPWLHPGLRRPAVLFRPIDHPAVDQWVRRTRQRWGAELLSRRADLMKLREALADGRWAVALFDQHAGDTGTLTFLFDRVASTTELPASLALRYRTPVYMVTVNRTAFWEGSLEMERLSLPSSPEAATITRLANAWLERHLSRSDRHCADWMWVHRRWKAREAPSQWLNLDHRKSNLRAEVALRPGRAWPQRTRFHLRLPESGESLILAWPVIRAMVEGRPDACTTLVGRRWQQVLASALGWTGPTLTLPEGRMPAFRACRACRASYLDLWWVFEDSPAQRLEAWLSGARLRCGPIARGRTRLLNRPWQPPAELCAGSSPPHPTDLWERMARDRGLLLPLDRSPVHPLPAGAPSSAPRRIGVQAPPDSAARVALGAFGTSLRQALGDAFPGCAVVDLDEPNEGNPSAALPEDGPDRAAGPAIREAKLRPSVEDLLACDLVLCHDGGCMHLANALGRPVLRLCTPEDGAAGPAPAFSTPVQRVVLPGTGSPEAEAYGWVKESLSRLWRETGGFGSGGGVEGGNGP